MHALAPLLALLLQAVPADDEKAVRAALEDLIKKTNDGDGKAFAAGFHVERMLDEVYAQAGVPLKAAAGRRLLRIAVGAALGQMSRQFADFGGWGALHRCGMKRLGEKPEVEVSCVLKDADGLKDRYRFWFVRAGDAWKLYDFESIHDGIRLSVLMSMFVNEQGLDPAKRDALAKAGPLMQKLMADIGDADPEEALRSLGALDLDALPPVLGSLMEVLEGALLSGLGREEQALAAYDRAVLRSPDVPRTHQLRWETCIELEKHDQAVASAKEFIRIVGEDAPAYAVMGRSWAKLGKTDDAEAAFRKGVAADDDDSDNRYELGLLLAARKPDEAKPLLLASIEKAEDPEQRYEEAAGALEERDACALLLALTVERVKKAGMPGLSELYYQGLALRRLGKPAEAEPVLREALKKDEDEDWRGIRQELACALGQLGRFDEARKLADEIHDSDDTEGAYVDAFLHALEGKEATALVDLRVALEDAPDLHVAVAREPAFEKLRAGAELPALIRKAKAQSEYDDRSSDLWARDRWEPLRALADARVQAAPEDAGAWYHLGLSLRQLGRHGEAEKALRSGLEKEKDADSKPRYWDELGQALARGGKPAEALEVAAKLLMEEHWQVEGRYVEALAHARSGKTDAAFASLEKLFTEDDSQLEEVEADAAFAELRKADGWAALRRRVEAQRKEDP